MGFSVEESSPASLQVKSPPHHDSNSAAPRPSASATVPSSHFHHVSLPDDHDGNDGEHAAPSSSAARGPAAAALSVAAATFNARKSLTFVSGPHFQANQPAIAAASGAYHSVMFSAPSDQQPASAAAMLDPAPMPALVSIVFGGFVFMSTEFESSQVINIILSLQHNIGSSFFLGTPLQWKDQCAFGSAFSDVLHGYIHLPH